MRSDRLLSDIVLKRRGDLPRSEAYKNGAAALKFQDEPSPPHLRRPLLYSAILAEFGLREERQPCANPPPQIQDLMKLIEQCT
jgi:hypothetical protein